MTNRDYRDGCQCERTDNALRADDALCSHCPRRKARVLSDVSFSVPAKPCVICDELVIDVGMTALCSVDCIAEWVKKPKRELSEEEQEAADYISAQIQEKLKAFSNPTVEDVKSVSMIVIEGFVSV